MSKDKIITVKLSDLPKVCENCGKVKKDTYNRRYYAKDYIGPCGDSFCYASCEMSACRETSGKICETCYNKLGRK